MKRKVQTGWMAVQKKGSENTLYEAVTVDTYHYLYVIWIRLSKQTECTIPNVNCNVNYRLWVIKMCYCRLISCNKCTTLVRNVDNGEVNACEGGSG